MSLTVKTSTTSTTPVHTVARATVQTHAHRLSSPFADQPELGGVTMASLRIDQSQLRYEQRRVEGRMEFRFRSGVLQLALWQRIYVADDTGACERAVWEGHERAHVADNLVLLPQLEGAIRRDPALNRILVNPTWRPIGHYRETQAAIEEAVDEIFRRLCAAAAARRDSPAEYLRIRRELRTRCH